ncbi:HET-domain-containing protein [Mytilinidion resinicola]|uniref:HET-domain-containing protein n=1 Tax=Mytilinidion resinicola TaxID=574789 RepID=A0A6A6Z1R6_9PEZI|nr:HET-domain-containing protein [Mytilinidion resinicola]KAF2814125.1 HET-domain-containing protein [Mytilinidion resinicola]
MTLRARAHSCRHCQTITIEVPKPNSDKNDDKAPLLFKLNGLKVEAAAADGCDFLAWALRELEHNERNVDGYGVEEGWKVDDQWEFAGNFYHKDIRNDGMCPQRLLCHWSLKGEKRFWTGEFGHFGILAEEDDPAARYAPWRPSNQSRSSDAAFSKARTWLKECLDDHSFEDCNATSVETMPTRVIDIDWSHDRLEPNLRLLVSPPREPYVALSYVWGGDQPMKTTKANLVPRCQELVFSDLHLTIQDAIRTTWNLSRRLLWVDSLCIIQDDPDDKVIEIAMMPEIYRNADLTISVACAASSQEGFLGNVVVPSLRAISIRLPYRCPDGKMGSIIVFSEPGEGRAIDPIEKRAWTLQESFLSRRILRYGTLYCSWVCRGHLKVNDPGRSLLEDLQWNTDYMLLNRKMAIYSRSTSSDIKDIRQQWRYIIEEYSSRSLSEHSDRLSAISALARFFGQRLSGQYAAGIWLEDLAQLLWTRASSPCKQRPEPCLAPSWSWASVDASSVIKFRHQDEYSQKFLDLDPKLRLMSHNITPADPFHASIGGHIEMEGLVRQAIWVYNDSLYQLGPGGLEEDTKLNTFSDTIEDASSNTLRSHLVWCLQICHYQSGRGPFGLILKTEDEQTWRRVGVYGTSMEPVLGSHRANKVRPPTAIMDRWISKHELRKIVIE